MRHVLLEVAMNWLRPTKKKFRFLCLFCQEKTLCVKDCKMHLYIVRQVSFLVCLTLILTTRYTSFPFQKGLESLLLSDE